MSAPSTAQTLLREDLRSFGGYSSARTSAKAQAAHVWLNANEAALPNPSDADDTLRRYPQPQPPELRQALAALYGVAPAQLLAGRGSDEGIDLLVRTFCTPGNGAIVIAPPVFGMYAVSARLHGVKVAEVPAQDGEQGFRCDLLGMAAAARDSGASLVFVCSPGNPTGEAVELEAIATLAEGLRGEALVVVDEAYAEFSSNASAVSLLEAHENIVVLRTLSKAHALAAARIGSVIASSEIISLLQRCQAPYPLPQPCVAAGLAALSAEALKATDTRVAESIRARDALIKQLPSIAGVRQVYPSQGNFVLLRFADAQAAFERLLDAGIMVRDMRAAPQLHDALRISIGTSEEMQRVLRALGEPQ